MPRTHGGPQKARQFTWLYDPAARQIRIENDRGRVLVYGIEEIRSLMIELQRQFRDDWFSLANNVELLGAGTERPGFGMTLLSQRPGNTTYAQGASYLGVILEEVGYLLWNNKHRGICWRIVDWDFELVRLEDRLIRAAGATSS